MVVGVGVSYYSDHGSKPWKARIKIDGRVRCLADAHMVLPHHSDSFELVDSIGVSLLIPPAASAMISVC